MKKNDKSESIDTSLKDWICQCGNTRQFEGFYGCDSDGYPTEDHIYFGCVRCEEIQNKGIAEKIGKHPRAPDHPIAYIEYIVFQKSKKLIADVENQQQINNTARNTQMEAITWSLNKKGFDTGYYLAETQPEILKQILVLGESQKYKKLEDWKMFDQLLGKLEARRWPCDYREIIKHSCLDASYRKELKEGEKALKYQLNKIVISKKEDQRKQKLVAIEKTQKDRDNNERER